MTIQTTQATETHRRDINDYQIIDSEPISRTPLHRRPAKTPRREAQKRLDAAWSEYLSLTRSLNEIGRRARHAHTEGRYDLEAHNQYHALIPEIEAQMHLLQQAMVDVEKAETARRAAYLAAISAIRR